MIRCTSNGPCNGRELDRLHGYACLSLSARRHLVLYVFINLLYLQLARTDIGKDSQSASQPDIATARRVDIIAELLGPNFQQKFAFVGRGMEFGVEILLTMLYFNIDRRKTF